MVYQRILGLTDSKHLGAAYRTGALGRRLTVLHGDVLSPFNLPLGFTFHTISLHSMSLLTVFVLRLNHLACPGQVGSLPKSCFIRFFSQVMLLACGDAKQTINGIVAEVVSL